MSYAEEQLEHARNKENKCYNPNCETRYNNICQNDNGTGVCCQQIKEPLINYEEEYCNLKKETENIKSKLLEYEDKIIEQNNIIHELDEEIHNQDLIIQDLQKEKKTLKAHLEESNNRFKSMEKYNEQFKQIIKQFSEML